MEDTANEFDEEKVKGDLSSTVMDVEISGHAPKLRNARKGKLAHLTKRKNLMLELMEDASCVQEVKENFNKFVCLLDDFKSLHETYQELLSEEEARQDEVEWFKPKMADINTFLSSVSEWLSGVSKAVEPQEIEVAPKDSISQISSRESRSRAFSVASASLQVEAERAAVLAKVAALREKHDLEDREEALNKERQTLKKKREVLELKAQLDASSAKLAVLMYAGKYHGASAATDLTSNPHNMNMPILLRCHQRVMLQSVNSFLCIRPLKPFLLCKPQVFAPRIFNPVLSHSVQMATVQSGRKPRRFKHLVQLTSMHRQT